MSLFKFLLYNPKIKLKKPSPDSYFYAPEPVIPKKIKIKRPLWIYPLILILILIAVFVVSLVFI